MQSWEGCETCAEDCFKNCFDGCFEDCFDCCFEDGFKDCFEVVIKIFEAVGRAQSSESSRVELSWEARPVKGPGLGQVWAWAWRVCYGDWLRNARSDVAIGCIIMDGCYD